MLTESGVPRHLPEIALSCAIYIRQAYQLTTLIQIGICQAAFPSWADTPSA